MLLDKKMATKCKYEWHKGEVKMTNKPPLIEDAIPQELIDAGFGSDGELDRQAALMMGDEEAIRADQRDIDSKWFKDRGYMSREEINQWLEEVGASGKVKCPDCAWNLFQGAEHIGMTPCHHCNSTGYLTEPLRMEEK